jgi:acyl-CoA thioester hydrolase
MRFHVEEAKLEHREQPAGAGPDNQYIRGDRLGHGKSSLVARRIASFICSRRAAAGKGSIAAAQKRLGACQAVRGAIKAQADLKETKPVNAPISRERAPRLDAFPFQQSDNIRFADLDPNNHVNNAAFAVYFESVRVALVRDPTLGLMPAGAAWVLVQLDTQFRAELHWPGRVDLGLGVRRIGRTSVTFAQAVFSSDGVCAASATATNVLIDRASRKPMPLTAPLIDRLNRFLVRAAP